MICANFGAFTTKPTILVIFDTNLLHYNAEWVSQAYQPPATLDLKKIKLMGDALERHVLRQLAKLRGDWSYRCKDNAIFRAFLMKFIHSPDVSLDDRAKYGTTLRK